MKQLRKSNNKMITGTAAGLAEYFDIDPTIIRIAFVLFVLFGGSGLLVYLVIFIIMTLSENK